MKWVQNMKFSCTKITNDFIPKANIVGSSDWIPNKVLNAKSNTVLHMHVSINMMS